MRAGLLFSPASGTLLADAQPVDSVRQTETGVKYQALASDCWLVLVALSVIAFVDRPGLPADPSDPEIARRHLGGTQAQP